jgi:hypothetical protein
MDVVGIRDRTITEGAQRAEVLDANQPGKTLIIPK